MPPEPPTPTPEQPNQPSDSTHETSPSPATVVQTPSTTPEPAKATTALLLGGLGLVAWLLPLVGFPITIAALVISVQAMTAKKKLAKLALALAVVGLIATVANSAIGAYMGYKGELDYQDDTSQSSDADNQSTNGQRYPEESRTAFIESCVSNGASQSQCSCMLNELENNLTYEEFAEVDREITQTGVVPESFRQTQANAQAACQ